MRLEFYLAVFGITYPIFLTSKNNLILKKLKKMLICVDKKT